MRVLIVEDDLDIATNLYEFLEGRGNVVDMARDGVSGMHLAVSQEFDAIVLDLGLPGMDGLCLCRKLRREALRDVPILILTARDVLDDKLAAFDCGADDYLVKPFALREVEARLKALVARRRGRVVSRKLVHGGIEFDPANLAVSVDGRPVHLSRKCLRLLEMMMTAPNRVYSRAELEQELWGDEHPQSDSLRSHMHMLRRALTDARGLSPIETVHGVGYRFAAADARQA
ncbi:MAG: DNA-binding response regulator [Rhodocyclales bacterium]|jgi:DNA-binding response OmpR family regulator|nr:response regulator transcription factor [Rhodocyclaceae bacterium]PWB44708.1 MAG: DNA-binding response regulator [Rhodocyclales bacterium]